MDKKFLVTFTTLKIGILKIVKLFWYRAQMIYFCVCKLKKKKVDTNFNFNKVDF